MRAYFFVNMYLSSIQQGIQSAHCLSEMYSTYLPVPQSTGECCFDTLEQTIMLTEWATAHKTMILLNAGYSETIRDIKKFFNTEQNPYPWASFNEGNDALDGALTVAGIILPEKIYETASAMREDELVISEIIKTGFFVSKRNDYETKYEISKWEFDLIKKINGFGLAR